MDNPQEGYVFRPTLWYNERMITPQYLAGLIDGEGYFGLIPSRVKGLKNASYEPAFKIGMTGESILVIFQELVATYGGHIGKRNGLTKGNREAYLYILKNRKKVLALLEDVLPYLIVKQQQGVLLKEFCLLPNTHSRYNSYDPTVLERKIAIYHEMKRLKQPEPLATTN